MLLAVDVSNNTKSHSRMENAKFINTRSCIIDFRIKPIKGHLYIV